MTKIAAETGIGRATLYKYFPDVQAILVAWHERQVADHLEQLATVRDQARAGHALEAVLTAYTLMIHERPHGGRSYGIWTPLSVAERVEPWWQVDDEGSCQSRSGR